jgi:hypothetical protein
VTDKREEPALAITTVAEYTGQSAIRVAETQLGPRYSSSDAKRSWPSGSNSSLLDPRLFKILNLCPGLPVGSSKR